MTDQFDDVTLMAFADGELEGEAARRVEAALRHDASLAARVEAFAASRRDAKAVFAGLTDAPVPEHLRRAVQVMVDAPQPRNVLAFPPGGRRGARLPGWTVTALAACVAAAIAAPLGYLAAGGGFSLGAREPLAVGSPPPTDVAVALASLPSGQEVTIGPGSRLRAIATFHDAEGTLCREVELDRADALVAVACREEQGWRVTFAVNSELGAEGYAPASSMAAMDAYLEAISAGEPLSPQDEAAALGEGR